MKANKVLVPILIGFVLVLGISIGSMFNFPVQSIALVESEQREMKLRQIIDYINYEYVDEVNTDSLLDLTINDLLKKLDPHSAYIPSAMAERTEESMRGSFEGIGIEFKIYRDTLTVIHTIKGGPSERAGIKQGDRILTADDKQLFGNELTSAEVISTLKGESGTSVVLNVLSPQNNSLEMVEVTRAPVAIFSVPMHFMLNSSTGYIKLLRFSQTASDEVREAINDLRKLGAEKMVLDLRDNPGGLMKAAKEISDEFLINDEVIVFTKDRNNKMSSFEASNRGYWQKGGLAIIINEGSASASEIVAGAVQDNDRGWVVGQRSFGKGLVQEEITLKDGSRIRLTTQKYYTPSGRSIQKPYESYGDYHGEAYFGENSLYKNPSKGGQRVYTTKGGRQVYGGGGILPDQLVYRDSSNANAFIYHLGLLANFDEKAFTYVDDNRLRLMEWSEDEFVNSFEIDSSIMNYFFSIHVNTVQNQSMETQELIKDRVKAFIAYNLYGSKAFQRVYAKYDTYIEKSLEVLQTSDLMAQKNPTN